MIQWRQDMDRLAMDNANLRAQLAAMDQQVAQVQELLWILVMFHKMLKTLHCRRM